MRGGRGQSLSNSQPRQLAGEGVGGGEGVGPSTQFPDGLLLTLTLQFNSCVNLGKLRNHSSALTSLPVKLCCCSVAKSCLTLGDPRDGSTQGFPVLHCLLEFAQTHVHYVVLPSNHFILCHPLLLLPSVFPSIRVFSNEGKMQDDKCAYL